MFFSFETIYFKTMQYLLWELPLQENNGMLQCINKHNIYPSGKIHYLLSADVSSILLLRTCYLLSYPVYQEAICLRMYQYAFNDKISNNIQRYQ